MTCTITKEKNRITGEQWVWEYTSACCSLAAGEMIQIQWDVTGDRLILQTSDSEDLELFQSDFLTQAYLLQHEGGPLHNPLQRDRLCRLNFPATSDLQAFTTGIPVRRLIDCARVTKKSSWLSLLPQSKDRKDENIPDEFTLRRCWCLLPGCSLPCPFCSLRAVGVQKEEHVQTEPGHQTISPLMPACWLVSHSKK